MQFKASSFTGMFVALFALVAVNVASTESSKRVSVTRLYTATDGQTHYEETTITMKSNGIRSEISDVGESSDVDFWRASSGFVNDWHPAPRRQYIIRISGRLQVELGGGQKLTFGPGSIILAEDLTGKGHITRCVGKEDCLSVRVALAGGSL